MVRAKMRVMAITPFATSEPSGVCSEIRMMPVFDDGNPENKTWSKYTPSGECRMVITKPEAIDAFEMGKSYYVDFTPVD